MCPQGAKVIRFITGGELLLPLSLHVVDKDEGRCSEKNSKRRGSLKTSPEGEQIYGERAIKSLYKDIGAEFQEYSVQKACMAHVNDAGGIR